MSEKKQDYANIYKFPNKIIICNKRAQTKQELCYIMITSLELIYQSCVGQAFSDSCEHISHLTI